MSAARRLGAIALLGGSLIGAGVVDGRFEPDPPALVSGPQMPVAAASTARSSAFYCAGTTASDGGLANGIVVVANAGESALSGTVLVVPSEGEPVSAVIDIGPLSRVDIELTEFVTAPYASATVVLDGGDAAVELVGTGPSGTSITACASAASPTWYFAEGVTTRDASEVLSLFNPFPEDALVDLRFMTEEGQVTPEDLTGLTVPGQSMVAVDLAGQVQRREQVATIIEVRTGRLVASRLQAFDGSNGREGASVTLGTPSPGTTWYFPDGFVGEGIAERIQLFNPSDMEASVEIDLGLEEGTAEPILLTVPPESRITMVSADESRIPKDEPHTLVVREVTGVGIVAERSIESVSPSTRLGAAYTFGSRLTARNWVLPAGRIGEDSSVRIVVLNPTDSPVSINVTLMNEGSPFALSDLQGIEVPPGGRWSAAVGEALRDGPVPLLVTASAPVVVERAIDRAGDLGFTKTIGIPLRD